MRITDKTISLDAAKLLGVPFTWGMKLSAFKFVHGDEGLEVWIYVGHWSPAYSAGHIQNFMRNSARWTLYRVELDDQEGTRDEDR